MAWKSKPACFGKAGESGVAKSLSIASLRIESIVGVASEGVPGVGVPGVGVCT